ncbi:barstar family protein [Actinocrispum wychmicini]|uniref:Barstar (Barnase inhibitor) n=1 Tax=Actinocrispum wychmicini TaxID=1213861 RepID=A0A4V6NNP3_9PSEU|nr:barstar family protein [Actinocrispum wychmicini]TCO50820.1 barstar (barnase inhibitor) [Actinocrispum wychmicini]
MRAVVDGREIRGKAAMLDALATALDFPDYFGHNYDALNDLVNDLPPGEHTVVWRAPDVLRRADPDAYEQIVDILTHADRLTVEFER